MSLDRSLKGKSTLERHRNVLKRSERIDMLEDNDKWTDGKSNVFGLLKVAHRKAAANKKPAKAEAVEGAATVATPGAAGAVGAAGKPAAGAPAGGKPGAAAAVPAAKAKK